MVKGSIFGAYLKNRKPLLNQLYPFKIMQLDPESALSLNSLKGAFVHKTVKKGMKEENYRIYDFYVDVEPSWDDKKDELSGFELSNICVTLVPLENGKLYKDKMIGRSWEDVKDYNIQLSGGFPNEFSDEIE